MRNLKTNISILILLFVSFLFTYKYSSRYTELGIYISVLLLVFQVLTFKYRHRINLSEKQKRIFYYGIIGFIFSLVVVSYVKIPVESLNVDRWSVISSFFTEMSNGNYPYYAKSHMGNYPGPMPIYFLISFPFYAIGELSILSSLGYCILAFLILKKHKNINVAFLLFYLLTSFYLIWEITTRSNVLTFSILILLVLNEFLSFRNKGKLNFLILALLTGFLLSTRSIFILVYIIFFLSSLLNKEITLKKMVLFTLVALMAFLSSFLPFIILFKNDFLLMNPFIVQSSFLIPKVYTVLFILISLLLAFFVKNRSDKFFYSGISLFISILIYSIYHLVYFGYQSSFIDSKVDISYFIFCIPFLIMFLINDKEDKVISVDGV